MEKRNTKRIKKGSLNSKPKHKKQSLPSVKNIIPVPGNSIKKPKRVGRGPGSGSGTTAARGQKGQKARASSLRLGFEGGQMRLYLRMPKRGFKNIFKEYYQPLNLLALDKLNLKGEITPEKLQELGLIKNAKSKIKILGTGDIKSAINITADAASTSAVEKIKKAGGQVMFRKVKE